MNQSVRELNFKPLPTEAELTQKAEQDRSERLRQNAQRILTDQKAQREREAAEAAAQARKLQLRRVELNADSVLLSTAMTSERAEITRRVNAESLIGKSDYEITSAYSDALDQLRAERDRY